MKTLDEILKAATLTGDITLGESLAVMTVLGAAAGYIQTHQPVITVTLAMEKVNGCLFERAVPEPAT